MQYDLNVNNLFDAYPTLERRRMFFDDELFLRFLLLMFAPDSTFSNETDLDFKIDLCLNELELDRESDIFRRYEEMDESVMDQIFELFRLFGNIEFERWISLRLSFAISSAQLRDPFGLKAGDRIKMMNELEAFSDTLLKLELKLFPDNDYVKGILSERAASKSLSGYAEKYAQHADFGVEQ